MAALRAAGQVLVMALVVVVGSAFGLIAAGTWWTRGRERGADAAAGAAGALLVLLGFGLGSWILGLVGRALLSW